MADDGSQYPRIPPRVSDWGELNRRVSQWSAHSLGREELFLRLFKRLSAYGGLAIDVPSAPYVGGPTVIANWGVSYPVGAILNVTAVTAAGTLSPDIDGVYQVSCSVSGAGAAGAVYTLDLYEDGIRVIGFTVDQSNQSTLWTMSFSFILDLTAGSVLDVRITASASTTIDHAVFSIVKSGLVDSDVQDLEDG